MPFKNLVADVIRTVLDGATGTSPSSALAHLTLAAWITAAAAVPLIELTAQAADPHKLHFRVVNSESLKPVAKARLTVIWTTNFPDRTTNVVTTDRQGTCLLPVHRIDTREWGCSIEVFKDGYVPKYVSWSERQGDEPSAIPPEYTTKLTPAINIGGGGRQ